MSGVLVAASRQHNGANHRSTEGTRDRETLITASTSTTAKRSTSHARLRETERAALPTGHRMISIRPNSCTDSNEDPASFLNPLARRVFMDCTRVYHHPAKIRPSAGLYFWSASSKPRDLRSSPRRDGATVARFSRNSQSSVSGQSAA